MDRYAGKALDERFSSRLGNEAANGRVTKCDRLIIDLTLDAYHEEESTNHTATGIDKIFKRLAIDQIKTFMFAGQDTTSSTICYVAYALSKYSEALRKVRQEYDEVFGTNVVQTPHLIKKEPYLINKLPYTVAIIKMILRFYPPVSIVLKGVGIQPMGGQSYVMTKRFCGVFHTMFILQPPSFLHTQAILYR